MSTRHIAAEAARLHDLTPEGSSNRASKRFRQKLAADGFTVDEGFRLKPGYLYTVVRAISARVNQNWDGWPSDELKRSYKTFLGKPVFVNHENHDPTKARGVVVAARYVENGMDKYIEVVQEIDAQRFPKLAHEIKTGGLDSVSMGAEAGFTICSYCHNKATDMDDMCDHVRFHKGKTLRRFDKRTGNKEDVLVFESCHKISFFELSYVFEPADETAVASKVVVAGLRTAEDVSVPAPPGTPTVPQSVIDNTPVIELSPATELTGHEATGLPKSSAYDAEIAEITRLAAECPPGMDCSRKMPQGEQITKDSPNNPVNQVSSDPNGTGANSNLGKTPASSGASNDGIDTGGTLKPQTQKLQDSLKSLYPGAEIGGYRPPDGFNEHSSGSALDFMTTDHDQAKAVMDHAFANGANYVIWDQKQWNPDGSTSVMEDRGSPTQNHKDHVHINVGSRVAGKYTKEDFNHPSGLKPWERDKESDAEDAAAIEIESMLLTGSATDDYWDWKAEHGEDAEHERVRGVGPHTPSRAQQQWLQEMDRRLAANDGLPPAGNAMYTSIMTTLNTYPKAHRVIDERGGPEGKTIDYGAGQAGVIMGDKIGHDTFEPYAHEGYEPTFSKASQIPKAAYHRVTSLNVLNTVPPQVRRTVIRGIGRALAPGGHAVVTARKWQGDVSKAKQHPDYPVPAEPNSVVTDLTNPRYQHGYVNNQELVDELQGHLGPGYTVTPAFYTDEVKGPDGKVRKVRKGVGAVGAHIVRNPSRTGMKNIARQRALRLAYGEQEAPMAVNTLREEGSAPEDDNNDFEQYVDKPDFASNIQPPEELSDPDLSQAAQIDRQQEISGAGADMIGGQPGPESMQPPAMGGAPQQQFMTLQIPIPAAQQAGVPMAAAPAPAPAQAAPEGQPMQIAASTLDYFDNYFGRRVANWLDAIEANRAFTPEEAADYRRQTATLSTLENGRELSTTNRNPGKEPANMARNTIASRNKVARAGRRQHLAEGPLTDGGPYGRNDQGEQEEAFLSQTPPAEAGDYVTDGTNISNTEHNLVARVQAGREQLLRDAQALASLRKRALTESGGPVAEVVDPTVNTGPEGEALTGDDFVSANPNDGVKPTNPHDASLRAFQAFDGWLAQKTGKSSRRHTEASIKKAAAQFSREAGISPQALFPALGVVLREARKNDKQANTKGAKMRKRADEKLEVAAPDGRVDVEAPVENVTSAEAQASQFDIHDFGNNAGDNVAKPDLSTDQNWAPGEASGQKAAAIKTAGGLLAMRCAEGMIAAGLEPDSRERKYALAAEFEKMNRGLIQDRVALLERFAAVREADRRKVASGSSRGAARSPIPAGLGGGTRTAAAGPRVAAHDPRNDSSLFI